MLALAIIPTIVLFIIVWRADKVEKEPPSLLIKLFLFGALTTVSAMIIGNLCDGAALVVLEETSLAYLILDNFIFTALVEEGGKYFVTKKLTWKHPAFNHTFDAVIYAVCASLGFATLENMLYLIDSDVTTAIMRGLLSVPGHVIDAMFMGCYYGMAKYLDSIGNVRASKSNLKKAILVPTLIHGFYDFCLSADNDWLLLAFFAFEIAITIIAIVKFKKLSREDTYIPQSVSAPFVPPMGYQPGQQQMNYPPGQQMNPMGYQPGQQPVNESNGSPGPGNRKP